MRVLLVEDDRLIGDGIEVALSANGYAVDWVQDGSLAAVAFETNAYDLCILDLGLPNKDGIDILLERRARGDAIPILVLTARDSRDAKIRGLDSGADDYVIKPFDIEELLARIRALTRRSLGRVDNIFRAGQIELDYVSRQVSVADKPVVLSAKEYELLFHFMSHLNQVQSKDQIIDSLYGWGREIESNAIEVHIHHLRRKLGQHVIKTVRNMGYVMEA